MRPDVSLVILELVGSEFSSPAVDFNVHVAKLALLVLGLSSQGAFAVFGDPPPPRPF